MNLERWANFFLATAGGAAALTGLIFVAVSLNLERILSFKQLPNRALGSLILLVNILTSSLLCLVPEQSAQWLGIEILVLGAAAWVVLTQKDIANFRGLDATYKSKYNKILLFTQCALLPYLVAGILLTTQCAAGLYFLVPAIVFSFFKSLMDAWVLLVEINR